MPSFTVSHLYDARHVHRHRRHVAAQRADRKHVVLVHAHAHAAVEDRVAVCGQVTDEVGVLGNGRDAMPTFG